MPAIMTKQAGTDFARGMTRHSGARVGSKHGYFVLLNGRPACAV